MYTSYVVLMWGSIPYIVPQEKLSTSYGFLTCLVNVFNTFFPLVITNIHDATEDGSYFWVEITFLGLCAFSLLLKAALYSWDKNERGGILQSQTPAQDFEKYIERKGL